MRACVRVCVTKFRNFVVLGGLYATLGANGSCPTNRQRQMQRTALFALVVVCGATLSAAIGNRYRDPNRNSGATLVCLVVYYHLYHICKTCFRSCARSCSCNCSSNSRALLEFQLINFSTIASPARTRLPRSFPRLLA